MQNFQTPFNILLHFASLQNIFYLHIAVHVWFTWNKIILGQCHLLGNSIESRLSHSPQNWNPYLLHSTNCEWWVTNLKLLCCSLENSKKWLPKPKGLVHNYFQGDGYFSIFILKLILPTHGKVLPPIMHVIKINKHFEESLVYNDLELPFYVKYIGFSQGHWLKDCHYCSHKSLQTFNHKVFTKFAIFTYKVGPYSMLQCNS